MDGQRADLHVHTRASDGLWSPAEVVREAARIGLAAVAVADHDTLAGVDEACREAGRLKAPRVIPAVEINTDHGSTEAHVLCYFPDLADQAFRSFLATQVESRLERARRMVDLLGTLGLRITWSRVLELAAGGSIGRPHVAAALIERGYVTGLQEAMDKWLGRGRPGYVPRRKLTPHAAVAEIVRAGGAAVLAHPGLVGCDKLIDELIPCGLVGVEAHHPSHTPAARERYQALARKKHLVVTGGSDFHGPGVTEGAGLGEVSVPVAVVQELLARLPRPRPGAFGSRRSPGAQGGVVQSSGGR